MHLWPAAASALGFRPAGTVPQGDSRRNDPATLVGRPSGLRSDQSAHARCLKTAGLKLSDGRKVTSWPRFAPAGRRHHAARLTSGET
jgi:hypothetical protein